jgi:hypothetical protein
MKTLYSYENSFFALIFPSVFAGTAYQLFIFITNNDLTSLSWGDWIHTAVRIFILLCALYFGVKILPCLMRAWKKDGHILRSPLVSFTENTVTLHTLDRTLDIEAVESVSLDNNILTFILRDAETLNVPVMWAGGKAYIKPILIYLNKNTN